MPPSSTFLVEIRTSAKSQRSICSLPAHGSSFFKIDRTYQPLAITPSGKQLQLSLESEREIVVLVRGTMDRNHIDDVLNAPSVVGIHADSEISPFNCQGVSSCDDWLIDVSAASPIDCPIPPCDSDPTKAHGCLLNVAEFLGADRIWEEGIDGKGVVVGIIDGGIWAEGRMNADLPGLVPRVVDGWPKENWGTIAGWRRHGNMMAIGTLGMAPKASIYDIRVSDSASDSSRMSDVIAGIHWALEKFRATGNPQILCCGWGICQQTCDPKFARDATHPVTRKIVEAMDEGILVLFAAGNGGQSCPATSCGSDSGPGKSIWGVNGHPRVMTVGAVNMKEQLIGYSSQGPGALEEYKPDFCGVSHYSGYFCSDSGTSAACAITSGVVALLKQARPSLTQEAAKRLLKSTAKGIGPPGWNRHTGAGIIQAKTAYDASVGQSVMRTVANSRIERLELENQYLRELFIELTLQKRMLAGRNLAAD